MATTHEPVGRPQENGHAIDCTCGHRGELWSTNTGAARAWLQHVVDELQGLVGMSGARVVPEWDGE